MTMRFSEALRLGSTLLERKVGCGAPREGVGCALQMAALAIGRDDIAYIDGTAAPDYYAIGVLFEVDQAVIGNVWTMNDGRSWWFDNSFLYSIEDIARYLETVEPKKEEVLAT